MWPVMTSDNIPLLLLSGKPVVGDNKGRCHAEEHELKPLALSNLVNELIQHILYWLCEAL